MGSNPAAPTTRLPRLLTLRRMPKPVQVIIQLAYEANENRLRDIVVVQDHVRMRLHHPEWVIGIIEAVTFMGQCRARPERPVPPRRQKPAMPELPFELRESPIINGERSV